MTKETTVTVEGMHCASCASGIEVFLRAQDGIEQADVDYDDNTVHVEYTEEADIDQCWDRIEEMGYNVQRGGDHDG